MRLIRGFLPWLVAMAATVFAVVVIANTVDAATLQLALQATVANLPATTAALLAFAAAFLVRSWAWVRVLPALPFWQSWAAINVSLAANHVLPLRLGEPFRVLSAVRRSDVGFAAATATTLTLRTGDFLGLLAIVTVMTSATIGAGQISFLDSPWLRVLTIALGVGLAIGLWWSVRLRSQGSVRLPGPLVIGATLVAWFLESALLFVVANGAGVTVTYPQAVIVSSAAVAAQILAITPGGIGTYEAGAVAAFVVMGVDPGVGVAIALVTHGLKTVYALLAGGVALVWPHPGLIGRLRLPRQHPDLGPPIAVGDNHSLSPQSPVVLFLPAFNETASVADVVARAPAVAAGHPVIVMVIDDGSCDNTAAVAEQAGAVVVRHERNLGLGAAVRTGLACAAELQPAAVAFCDADGEYAPEELERLVTPVLLGKADYLIGSRFTGTIEHMRPHRRFGNQVLTVWMRFITHAPITDGQSGYRVISNRAAAGPQISYDFNYAQVLTIDMIDKGYGYRELPITYSFRTTGDSFVKLAPYLRRVIPGVHRRLNENQIRPTADESSANKRPDLVLTD